MRTGNCVLACIFAREEPEWGGPQAHAHRRRHADDGPEISSRNPISCQVLKRCDSTRDIAMIGATSPTVPAAITMRPNARIELPAIAEDQQQHAQAGSAQCQRDHHRRMNARHDMQQGDHREADQQRDGPSRQGQRQRRPRIREKSSSMPGHEQGHRHGKLEHRLQAPPWKMHRHPGHGARGACPSTTSITTTGTAVPIGMWASNGAATAAAISQKTISVSAMGFAQ